MCEVDWDLASKIASTFALLFTALGLFIVIIQLQLQRNQSRLDALSSLYLQFDTHEARIARQFIYNTSPENLRLKVLQSPKLESQRKLVDDTLAMLERMAYPIVQGQIPSIDAFNLYGGVLLSIVRKLWPYILDQRELRSQNTSSHQLLYRRYLEKIVHKWAMIYADQTMLQRPSKKLSTMELLENLFQTKAPNKTM